MDRLIVSCRACKKIVDMRILNRRETEASVKIRNREQYDITTQPFMDKFHNEWCKCDDAKEKV